MKKIFDSIHSVRYRLFLFFLLGGATVVSVALYRFRGAWYNETGYSFLVWNLFLAWIPLGFAYAAWVMAWNRRLLFLAITVTAFLWLIFFPNAPYILTDFQHLGNPSEIVPIWFDVILVVWFAWTGLLLGVISLYLMHDVVHRAFGRAAGWLFVCLVSFLSGIGIYIGRFIRWNSWDILQQPNDIFYGFVQGVSNPSLRSIGVTALFGAFFLFVYLTFYTFGHLLRDDHNRREA
ncbi:MAG: hypothetical protein HFACDABA_00406 [Anaerolineales bacterium]|nr:hypothetical protein [Anaerolineales bacterium]